MRSVERQSSGSAVCAQARAPFPARIRTMVRIPHVFLIAPRGRLQVLMEPEVKTAEHSQQAIMRGRKQMPLKVVPEDSLRRSPQGTFASRRLTLLVQNS